MTFTSGDGEVWRRARRAFEELLDLGDDDRQAKIEELRRDEPEVHAAVRELLETEPVEDDFLQPPTRVREENWSFGPAGARSQPKESSGVAAEDVLDDFRLVRRIGEGGMGQVWEAEQISLGGRRIALKLIRPEQVSEQTIQLFRREARAGGRLSHPGIVAVHGYGEADGVHWIAMELVPGNWTLKDFLKEIREEESIPADYYERISELVIELSESLQVAHDAGIVHRDLKPQNILITPENRSKLTDFGLARVSDDSFLSRTGDFAGTYAYMSPEQITAKRMGLDHRTDVFSLGVVLYELLTLHRPFEGDTTHQIATKIVTHDPPEPSKVRSQCPRELSAIVGKAMEKQPDRRYSTAAELAADLQRFLEGRPIHAKLPSPVRRVQLWTRRNRVAATAMALLSILLGLSVFGYVQSRTVHALRSDAFVYRISQQVASLEIAERSRRSLAVKPELASELASIAHSLEERLTEVEATRRDYAAELVAAGQAESIEQVLSAFERAGRFPFDNLSEPLQRLERELPLVDAMLEASDTRADWAAVRAEFGPVHDALTETLAARELVANDLFLPEATGENGAEGPPLEGAAALAFALRDPDLAPARARELALDRRSRVASHAATFRVRAEAAERLGAHQSSDRGLWSALNARLANSDAYYGLELAPQAGLAPLGPDPSSGLEEFAHLLSGEVPLRNAETGELELNSDSAIVLVLVPEGQLFPPEAMYEPEPAFLEPYFLAKHELSRAQYRRMDDLVPELELYFANSIYNLENMGQLEKPANSVSWLDAAWLLAVADLRLPAEAEWLWATTAGEEWPSELEQWAERENVLDEAYLRMWKQEGGPYDDGFSGLAGIHAMQPNPWGFHQLLGNVQEWSADAYDDADRLAPAPPGETEDASSMRVLCGVGWTGEVEFPVDAILRDRALPGATSRSIGIRAARSIR